MSERKPTSISNVYKEVKKINPLLFAYWSAGYARYV